MSPAKPNIDKLELAREEQRKRAGVKPTQSPKRAAASRNAGRFQSTGTEVSPKQIQSGAEVAVESHARNSLRRQDGTIAPSSGSSESSLPQSGDGAEEENMEESQRDCTSTQKANNLHIQSTAPRKAKRGEQLGTETLQADQEDAPVQQTQLRTRQRCHRGGVSVKSMGTGSQLSARVTEPKPPSEERLIELSTPKHFTRKYESQKASPPQTGRIKDRRFAAQQKGVELSFKDHWSNLKIQREVQELAKEYIERGDQPMYSFNDLLAQFTSLFGGDKRQKAMERQIQSLETKLHHSQMKNEELKSTISEFSHAKDSLVEDLRRFQQKSFNQRAKSTWTPLEDLAIQAVLEEIHEDIEVWAEENCVESYEAIQQSLTEEAQTELFQACKNVADVTQDNLATQFRWWERRSLEPHLLLTALMTFHMYSCVFNNEFMALEAIAEGSMSMTIDVYRKLLELDFKQAQVWRSQMMRIIVETPQSATRFDGLVSRLGIADYISHYCSSVIGEFMQRPEAAFLKSRMTDESRKALLICWIRAAELFVQLQTQVAKAEWSTSQILRSAVSPLFVKSHRCQAFPKGRNDGKPISLVISPMISFFGNEDGEKYDDWRPVCRATILVIDEMVEETEESEAGVEETDNMEGVEEEVEEEL